MTSQYPTLNNKPIDHWKVTELKEELRRRGLSVTGLKQELVRKLDEALQKEMEIEKSEYGLNLDSEDQEKGDQQEEHAEVQGHSDGAAETIGKPQKDGAINDIGDSNLNVGQIIVDLNEETATLTGADATLTEATTCVDSVEHTAIDRQKMVAENDSNVPDPKSDEKDDSLKAVVDDTQLNMSEPDNQVPVVSPDLGPQVKSESIPTDSVSIFEKNKLKDNLNADNFHLELEVVKPEMVQPSSSSVPPLGGDLQPLDVKEEVGNLASTYVIDANNSTELDPCKKEEIVDVGSPEKLNLDHNSDEELMEEDVLEIKQIETSIKSEELEEAVKVNQASPVEERFDALPGTDVPVSIKTDVVDEQKVVLTIAADKRKLEDNTDVGNEGPIKRQRRWNLEMVKLSEEQASKDAISTAPKNSFQPSLRDISTRTDPKPSEDSPKDRDVPPSRKPATTSLRIDKFVRPFTLKAVQEMLSKTGVICSFWMDHIKTHCYVTYESVEEATATRNVVYNLQWPPNGGNCLVAEFVDPQDVKMRVEAPPQSTAPISPIPSTAKAYPFQQPKTGQPSSLGEQPLHQQLPPPPPLPQPPSLPILPARERLPPPPLPKKPEPPVLTLEDLFMKTKATPRIYYLPLTDEQVGAKLAAQAKNTRQYQGMRLY